MDSPKRAPAAPLVAELLRRARRFDFYQAVRILTSDQGERVPVGSLGPVEDETIRFRPAASLGFASADTDSIERLDSEAEERSRYRVTVNFLGLYGAVSPLPAFYTEAIISGNEQESNRRDFLDLFHHRYISLLFRCFEKYRFYLRFRPGGRDQSSRWLAGLAALDGVVGEESPAVAMRERLLSCLGVLLQGSRSAPALERILTHYFNGPAFRVRQFVKRHVTIRPEQRARLGASNARLGQDCTLGERVPDIAGRFRLEVGPLDFPCFLRFLPEGDYHGQLREVMPFLLKDQLEHDLALGLKRDEVPRLDLGPDNPCRLGWSTWLATERREDPVVILPLRQGGSDVN